MVVCPYLEEKSRIFSITHGFICECDTSRCNMHICHIHFNRGFTSKMSLPYIVGRKIHQ